MYALHARGYPPWTCPFFPTQLAGGKPYVVLFTTENISMEIQRRCARARISAAAALVL